MRIKSCCPWFVRRHESDENGEYVTTIATLPAGAVSLDIELDAGTYTTSTWEENEDEDGGPSETFILDHPEIRKVMQPGVVLV